MSLVYRVDDIAAALRGSGRCLEAGPGYGIDEEEAEYLLRRDSERMAASCEKAFSYWHNVSANIRETVIMLCFQMGVAGFQKFRNTNRYIDEGDFEAAADELLDSKFAQQTPARAERMAARLRAG